MSPIKKPTNRTITKGDLKIFISGFIVHTIDISTPLIRSDQFSPGPFEEPALQNHVPKLSLYSGESLLSAKSVDPAIGLKNAFSINIQKKGKSQIINE